MFIRRKDYQEMIATISRQVNELKRLKDDSGEAIIERLTDLAKQAKIDVHSDEYQSMMTRVFMDIGGRESKVLKAYSGTAFMKDNPQEILERLKEFQQQANIITKQLEDKKKK